MPSTLPVADPAPADGGLPPSALAAVGRAPFGFYVHVPFCAVRCGYCDFNTYTAAELGGGGAQAHYATNAIAEVRLARRVLGGTDIPVRTVFFGGGTPTLLPAGSLGSVLHVIDSEFGLSGDAEVTVEANPESVDASALSALREAGFTRISFGMQSAVPHVLHVLDRCHTPGRVGEVVEMARAAGFDSISLDLIYGAPGESVRDWRRTLDALLAFAPDHVSAYALIVEEGTRLAVRVARRELMMPTDDETARKYELVDELLGAAGYHWYELSNWAKRAADRCRHNVGYWAGHDWWGVGPGAHSHVAGTRWWNVKHPTAYAARLAAAASPAHGREVLTGEQRRVERVLLGTRLASGHPLADLRPAGQAAGALAVQDGLLDEAAFVAGRVKLTLRGRLLADAVVRDLVD